MLFLKIILVIFLPCQIKTTKIYNLSYYITILIIFNHSLFNKTKILSMKYNSVVKGYDGYRKGKGLGSSPNENKIM